VSERRARHSHRAEMRTTQAHTRRRSVSHEGGLMRMQQQSTKRPVRRQHHSVQG